MRIGKRFPFGQEKHLNVSIIGQNLLTISDYTGPDPEPSLADRGASLYGGSDLSLFQAEPLAPGMDRRNRYLPSRTIVLAVGLEF